MLVLVLFNVLNSCVFPYGCCELIIPVMNILYLLTLPNWKNSMVDACTANWQAAQDTEFPPFQFIPGEYSTI